MKPQQRQANKKKDGENEEQMLLRQPSSGERRRLHAARTSFIEHCRRRRHCHAFYSLYDARVNIRVQR